MALKKNQIDKLFGSVKAGNISDLTKESLKKSIIKDTENGSQTVVNETSNDNKNLEINQFYGLQSNLLNYLFDSIENQQVRVTKELTIAHIMSGVEATKNMVKQAIYRCKQKNVISVKDRKDGRGGWCKYQLSKSIFTSIQNSKNKSSIYNSSTTINKYSDHTKEQKTQNYQLIDLLKKQNDQFQQQIAELQKQFLQQVPYTQSETKTITLTKPTETNTQETDGEDWTNLDFSSLTVFGFTKRHVIQIKNFNKTLDADNKLTVNSVQESIDHYAWALQNRLEEMASYAPSNNRLRGLIGVLKKGGNWTEANYKSHEDLAFEAALKAKKERLEKIKVQKEEAFKIDFELWRESLTKKQLIEVEEKDSFKNLMPPSAFKVKGDNKYYVNALKNYFRNNIYKG